MQNRAILFDLDGTLIDQFEAIHTAFSKTLLKMGFPEPSYDKVKRSVGGSSDITMEKLIGRERAQEAVEILRPIFEEEMLQGLKVLPGVLSGLRLLHKSGFKCAVLTNKFGPHARATCQHLGLDEFLEFTLGASDTEWKKPNKQFTETALNKFGFSPSSCDYVGDSPYDFQTAKNAGLKCHLLATGTHSFEELSKLQSAAVYPDFKSFVLSLLDTTKK